MDETPEEREKRQEQNRRDAPGDEKEERRKSLAEARRRAADSDPTAPLSSNNVEALLTDSENQRGVAWRGTKILAIRNARGIGHTEEWIRFKLKQGGLTDVTANRLMRDATEKEPEK